MKSSHEDVADTEALAQDPPKSLTYSQSLFQVAESSKDQHRVRKLRTRSLVACNQCRAAKARCNDYRPCGRCIENREADKCSAGHKQKQVNVKPLYHSMYLESRSK